MTCTTKAGAWACTAVSTFATAHLSGLLLAAIFVRGRRPPAPRDDVSLAVVIPAHEEEAHVRGAVRSVQAATYPSEKLRVIVVADNCSDRTAAVARAAGAEVWERVDPLHHGKGYALDWVFTRLAEDERIEAICVVDADCEISENLLSAVAARVRAGADALQVPYLISNPEASAAAALRWAGFALYNVLRPLGRYRLGLSSGLLGTGMAMSCRLLVRSPWRAFSFAEDREQHMRWALDGVRVDFVPEAQVRAPAPRTPSGARTQSARWDSGRATLAACLTPRLLARWLRTRERAALDAALEPLLPPQSVLLATTLLAIATSRHAGTRPLVRAAAGAIVAQVAYVVGGLAAVGAPPSVWRALVGAPRFVAGRLLGLSAMFARRGPTHWERTERGGRGSAEHQPSDFTIKGWASCASSS